MVLFKAAVDLVKPSLSSGDQIGFGSLGAREDRLRISRVFAVASQAFAALICSRQVHAADAPPLPGYWELSNTWTFVISFKSVDRKCFTAADVSGVLQGPSNAHYACTYPVREANDGRLSLEGTCVEKHGQVAEITAQGTYGPTAFQLTAHLRTRIAGLALSGVGTTSAHRLSEECPSPVSKSPRPAQRR